MEEAQMKKLEVDVAVIGAGTAGLAAYRAAKARGKRVVLIEGGEHGTTCARVGCMPSKLLIAAAEACHEVRQAAAFGVVIDGEVRVDGRAVMERVRTERDRFVGFVVRSVENYPGEDKLTGYARFIGRHRLEVRTQPGGGELVAEVEATTVVIATGSSPAIPPPFRVFGERLLVNDDVFDWNDLPESVAVFGPGVIGLELGQALHRLGVRVRVFGIGNAVGPISDPEVAQVAREVFGRELPLDADVRTTEMALDGERPVIGFIASDGRHRREHFDYVLVATGRRPNVAGLGLEHAGLELDERGVPKFDPLTGQCGRSHVFIAGDATHDRPLLHEAADEGRIAGGNAATYPEVTPGHRRTPLGIVFSDPQIAVVGRNYRQLTDDPTRRWLVGSVSFDDQGRSRVMLKNRGLLRVYVDAADGEVLGAEMLGPRAEHLAHLLAWSVQQRLTVQQMLEMPFYHPVIEEGLRTALRDAAERLEQLHRQQPDADAA